MGHGAASLTVAGAVVACVGCGLSKPNPLHGVSEAGTGSASASDGTSGASTVGSATSAATTQTSATTATATVTTASSSTMGGSSGTDGIGCDPPCLIDRGLVVRYFLDEPDLSAVVADRSGVGEPVDMDITLDPADEEPVFVSGSRGRGLQWSNPMIDGGATAPIDGTKIESMLDGATEGTLEVVFLPVGYGSQHSRIVHFGREMNAGRFTLRTDELGVMDFVLSGSGTATVFSVPAVSERMILHLVFDSNHPDVDQRAKLFVNGLPRMALSTPEPITEGQDLDLQSGAGPVYLTLGNREIGQRSFAGTLFYAAVYNVALRENEIATNVVYLQLSDDRP